MQTGIVMHADIRKRFLKILDDFYIFLTTVFYVRRLMWDNGFVNVSSYMDVKRRTFSLNRSEIGRSFFRIGILDSALF